MKCLILQLAALLLTISTFAQSTAELVSNQAALDVLNKKCIRLGTSEVLPIQFETACIVLRQQDLVHAVQEEFIRTISEDGNTDFKVLGNDPEYYYVNEKDQRTEIIELYRKQTDEYSFNYIIMASGKRFFGKYDVVIHLQVVDAGPAGIVYSVKVHAYPHSWLTRSSHKIGLTRSFFKKKTKMISWVAREVGTGLCAQEEMKAELVGGLASPPTGLADIEDDVPPLTSGVIPAD